MEKAGRYSHSQVAGGGSGWLVAGTLNTKGNRRPDDWLGLPLGRAGSPSPPLSRSSSESPSANGRFGEPSLPKTEPQHPIRFPVSVASRRNRRLGQHAVLPLPKQEGRPCGRPFQTTETLYSELDTLVPLTGRLRRCRRCAWPRWSTRSSLRRCIPSSRPWEPSRPWPSRCWRRRGCGGSRWS